MMSRLIVGATNELAARRATIMKHRFFFKMYKVGEAGSYVNLHFELFMMQC